MTLELIGISKTLGDFTLHEFSLTVKEGAYFVLLGPSGVGKSVLLETIAGLCAPDSGGIFWKGVDVTKQPPENRGFALVYQDYALFPHLSVLENIAYSPRSRGAKKTEAYARANDAAVVASAEHLLNRIPATLSGGEAQRVALARAIAASPQLLLLDEPLSAVDMRQRRGLRRELKRIHAETRVTIFHVTHDVDEAMEVGEEIAVMLDGRVRACGTPEKIFGAPSDPDVAEFLGLRNVIAAEYDGERFIAGGVRIHARPNGEISAGCAANIWIRPEEILLSRARLESSARNSLECTIESWRLEGALVTVQMRCGALPLTAMITHASFEDLALKDGGAVFATFKSSSVRVF